MPSPMGVGIGGGGRCAPPADDGGSAPGIARGSACGSDDGGARLEGGARLVGGGGGRGWPWWWWGRGREPEEWSDRLDLKDRLGRSGERSCRNGRWGMTGKARKRGNESTVTNAWQGATWVPGAEVQNHQIAAV